MCLFQIRYEYGLTDEVFPVEGVDVRHCNWVRFLQEAPYPDRANVECIRVKDDVIIRVIKPIDTNEELQAFFHYNQPKSTRAIVANTIGTGMVFLLSEKNEALGTDGNKKCVYLSILVTR